MDPLLAGDLRCDVSRSAFSPDPKTPDMRYSGLACACGGQTFHVSGWPRVAIGGGGFFWRSIARVFREARIAIQDGEPVESPFCLPVFARCDACGSETALLRGAASAFAEGAPERSLPRESYRCRVCRRGSVVLAVGEGVDSARPDLRDYEVVVRCDRCERQARLAWSMSRPTEQEVRLDLLYGRR